MTEWRYVGASVTGTSHHQGKIPCQDANQIHLTELRDGTPFLVLAVSDGAGSASHSHLGSSLACDYFVKRVEQQLCNGGCEITDLDAVSLVQGAAHALRDYAEEYGLTPRNMACTLIGAIVLPNHAFYLQVGDGALIADSGRGLEPIFWPERGEYANETYFILDVPIEHIQYGIYESPIQLALMSDGLQMLALDYATKTVHLPFLQRFYKVLEQQDAGCNLDFAAAVAKVLDSVAINSRTDDDKTLLLVERIPNNSIQLNELKMGI